MDHRTNARPHLWGMECREPSSVSGTRIRAWWATSRQPEGAMQQDKAEAQPETINGRAA